VDILYSCGIHTTFVEDFCVNIHQQRTNPVETRKFPVEIEAGPAVAALPWAWMM